MTDDLPPQFRCPSRDAGRLPNCSSVAVGIMRPNAVPAKPRHTIMRLRYEGSAFARMDDDRLLTIGGEG